MREENADLTNKYDILDTKYTVMVTDLEHVRAENANLYFRLNDLENHTEVLFHVFLIGLQLSKYCGRSDKV